MITVFYKRNHFHNWDFPILLAWKNSAAYLWINFANVNRISSHNLPEVWALINYGIYSSFTNRITNSTMNWFFIPKLFESQRMSGNSKKDIHLLNKIQQQFDTFLPLFPYKSIWMAALLKYTLWTIRTLSSWKLYQQARLKRSTTTHLASVIATSLFSDLDLIM